MILSYLIVGACVAFGAYLLLAVVAIIVRPLVQALRCRR